jgi:hypothetical protein
MNSKKSIETKTSQTVIQPNPFPSKFIWDGTIMTGGLKKESLLENTEDSK